MENASKALLIAGGVLIALITIGLLVRSFSTISDFQMSKLSQEEQEELIAFNEQYTKYANQYVYGTEVRSLINKYDNDKLVKVEVDGEVPPTFVGGETKYYKCTEVIFDNNNGRVCKIKFKQVTPT